MNKNEDQKLIQHYISKFSLAAALPEPHSLFVQLYRYEANELILREGDELDGLYFQVEGRTRVSSSVTTGKSLLLRFCSPLSIYGDIEYLQGVPVQSQVEALQPTTLLFVNKRHLEPGFTENHALKELLLLHLSYKLLTCTSASRTNSLGSVDERLASYLLTIQSQREFGKEMQTTHLPDIASLIGTTPRHLNRVIQKLADKGIVSKSRKEIIVLDWERLDQLSQGIRYE